MKNYRILAGIMVVFFVTFVGLSVAAHARGSDDDSSSGHHKTKKLNKHEQLRADLDAEAAARLKADADFKHK